jgi:3-dehydroquinate dehydratase
VSQINGDNLNSIGYEASRHYMNKKRDYLEDRIHEIATNNKNKNIKNLCRDLN